MTYPSDDTIFARSSGAGRAGIAVWRVSGPAAKNALVMLLGELPKPRMATYRHFTDKDGDLVDDGLCLWFPSPNSATGEDLVEFHLHGSPAVSVKITQCLGELGFRIAEPGEFTLRALSNGKMDLLEVEGLGDLLEAETEAQRQQALLNRSGEARHKVDLWRDKLVGVLAALEAAVDFPDEEDIPETIASRALPLLGEVCTEMKLALSTSVKGGRLREGVRLAILGPPNAGKSSLLNKLVGEERAIVSDIEGTTRDVITASLDIKGRLVHILDTAGIRADTEDVIEQEGISRSFKAGEAADLVLWVSEASFPQLPPSSIADHVPVLPILNKVDVGVHPSNADGLYLSVTTGQGWEALMTSIEEVVESAASPTLFPRERQQLLLARAVSLIDAVLENPAREPELLSEDTRATLHQLSQLVGQVTPDHVLGSIFSSFCIGK
ncbi:MAG: tRNA uridine-5-carboxymethylaminomethyl(34) synthesis GTPase MnmE [Pseudomonadota bacterium]